MRREIDPTDIILELVRLGPVVRISAIEPESLIEVVLQGPASAGEAALRRAVLAKLAYVCRAAQHQPHQPMPEPTTPARPGRPQLEAVRQGYDGPQTGESRKEPLRVPDPADDNRDPAGTS